MSQQLQYRVARGSVRLPRDPKSNRKFNTASDFVIQGQVLPVGAFSDQDIARLVEDGRVEPLATQEAQQAAKLPARRGKWGVDPVSLAGKSFEDLIVMVLEIDNDYKVQTLKDEGECVRQLTADWDPAFRDQISKSSDKSRPERLRSEGTKDRGSVPMSDAAEAALARAKERAAGQVEG